MSGSRKAFLVVVVLTLGAVAVFVFFLHQRPPEKMVTPMPASEVTTMEAPTALPPLTHATAPTSTAERVPPKPRASRRAMPTVTSPVVDIRSRGPIIDPSH